MNTTSSVNIGPIFYAKYATNQLEYLEAKIYILTSRIFNMCSYCACECWRKSSVHVGSK